MMHCFPRSHVIGLSALAVVSLLSAKGAANPMVAKAVLDGGPTGENRLRADAWRPYEQGFARQDGEFFCDNGRDATARRGASQNLTLNQLRPEPIVAACWSRAEGVGGSPDADYALYLDLIYSDGTPLWGQTASFAIGTHDWQRRQVVVLPEKPVREISFHMLFRGHAGKAWFRSAELHTIHTPNGAFLFDGLPVAARGAAHGGFQLRDVAAGSDFVYFTDPDAPPELGAAKRRSASSCRRCAWRRRARNTRPSPSRPRSRLSSDGTEL